MPLILSALGGLLISLLRQYLPGIIGRVLLALGIGFFTHKLAMPALLGMVQDMVSGMPARLVAYYAAFGLDVVMTILLSAYVGVRSQRVLLKKLGTAT